MSATTARTSASRITRPATPANGSVTWSAVDLAGCRTDFLRSIDCKRIAPAAARAVEQELAARRRES